jgi:hypothetical protein
MRPIRLSLAALALATVGFVAQPARAHDAYSDAESHPLKIASYPVAVAGFALEWLFTRPVHFFASQPPLQRAFNYAPTYNAFDEPDPYLPAQGPGGPPLPADAQILSPPGGGYYYPEAAPAGR